MNFDVSSYSFILRLYCFEPKQYKPLNHRILREFTANLEIFSLEYGVNNKKSKIYQNIYLVVFERTTYRCYRYFLPLSHIEADMQ